MKKIIDLTEGAKILGRDEVSAQNMLECLVDMFSEVRGELNQAYHEYQSDHLSVKFGFVVEKFYEGLLYVGAPALRQSVCDFSMALREKKQQTTGQLYQRVLNEMDALERKIVEIKMTDSF